MKILRGSPEVRRILAIVLTVDVEVPRDGQRDQDGIHQPGHLPYLEGSRGLALGSGLLLGVSI